MAASGKHSQQKHVKEKKGRFPKGIKALIIILSILCTLLIVAGVGLFYFDKVRNKPQTLFADPVVEAKSANVGSYKPGAIGSVLDLPDLKSTSKPVEVEVEKVDDDTPEEKDIISGDMVNIMLMGIDAWEDGSTTSGKEVHADVCMVLTINFKKNKVDLTTIPRDTFTTTPGYYGFYKMNGTFNVGGGMDNKSAGFEQVCRTAEEWIGGVSIPYYYAVDFRAVKDLVDAIGGIDYDVDQGFYDEYKHYYRTGMQHLDGKAVLGYLRVRRSADGKDRSRTARQRKMLVAIFKKLKSEGSLATIPNLISSLSDEIWTNTNLTQTAALANFALKVDPEGIGTHVFDGKYVMTYDWAFTFTNQQDRIDIIKDIWGVDAEPMGFCTAHYEYWLHNGGFTSLKTIRQAEKVIKFVNEQVGSGKTMTEEQQKLYKECYYAYDELLTGYNEVADWYEAHPEMSDGNPESRGQLDGLRSASKNKTLALAKAFDYDTAQLTWSIDTQHTPWYYDSDINQVRVDFG